MVGQLQVSYAASIGLWTVEKDSPQPLMMGNQVLSSCTGVSRKGLKMNLERLNRSSGVQFQADTGSSALVSLATSGRKVALRQQSCER